MITPEECRTHAANYEKIWRGQPGYSEEHNMAVEWRRAADTIEAFSGTGSADKLAGHRFSARTGRRNG